MGKPYGRSYVLITGATTGIGYELAKLYASDGNNLILVARDEQRLREVKEEFSLETYNPILRAFLQCEDGCQFFFTLECDDTNVKIDDESVEKMRQDKDNIYEPVWVEFESVKDLLVPKLIVDKFYEITSSNKILFFKE